MSAPKKSNAIPFVEFVLAFIATILLFPQPYHATPNLDSSWQVVLEEGFFGSWQFGKEIIFTGGPLSFLYSPTSLGFFPRAQVLAEAALLFGAIFTVFLSARRASIWFRLIIFLVLVCASVASNDGIFLMSVTAAGFLLLNPKIPFHYVFLLIVFIALLGFVKFTLAIAGAFFVGTVCCLRLIEKKPKSCVQIIVLFLLSVLLVWVVIGQQLQNIIPYFHHSWLLSHGYAWSMHLPNADRFIVPLLGVLLLSSIPIFLCTLTDRTNPKLWAAFFIAAFSIYLSWKSGITRFGTHNVFFLQGAVVVPILFLQVAPKTKWSTLWIVAVTALFAVSFLWIFPTNRSALVPRAIARATFGTQFIATAGKKVFEFSDLIPYIKSSHELPQIESVVGSETVDVLYYHQGKLLLRDLNYHPRPTIQNYPAYNHHLASWNQRHMQTTPPAYILCTDGVIDNRYPTMDDNLFFREVLDHYVPTITEDEYLLLERSSLAEPFEEGSPLLKRTVASGEPIDLVDFSETPLWLRVNYEPGFLHKVEATMYKPEILTIQVTTTNGESEDFRLIGGNLKNGFLLSPLLDSVANIEGFLKSDPPAKKIRSFSISSTAGLRLFSTRTFEIELRPLTR